MAERRALLIGVSGFTEPEGESLNDLDFAADAVLELAQVLRDSFGYSVESLTDPGLTTARLGTVVQSTLEAAGSDDIVMVHLLTHGVAHDGYLYALGSDAEVLEKAEIGHWLAGLQHVEGRPLALFTLDLCESGLVTRLPWQAGYDSAQRRGWVIAACEPDQDAFNGHFTRALTAVLRDVANHNLEIDPALEYVPFATVARAVRSAVTGLAEATHTYPQRVTASTFDLAAEPPAPPIFVNLRHAGNVREPLRSIIDPVLLPFLDDLDEGLDARHFVERAAGSAGLRDLAEGHVGCFNGRARQLRRLSPWLNGEGEQALSVVTGSPGVGKSALLGLLVCAAHPALRDATKPIWDKVTQTPMPISLLGAVHARQSGLSTIAAGLGRQLGLGDAVDSDEFLTALPSLPGLRPVIILDALDESEGAADVAAWLARMTSLTRPDGSPAVRLLVATREYPESAALMELAEGPSGQLIDLDGVPQQELEDDLHGYVINLLRAVPAYRSAGQVAGAFAGQLARTLASERGSGWGEFLVAGLYTRHFISTFQLPEDADTTHLAKAAAAAEHMAQDAPRTLPEVLELDLTHRPDKPWLRPALTALAHARGSGMPASVIVRIAGSLRPEAPAPSLDEIQTALRAGRFYLRQSSDHEKVTVFRLFHEGLAEYLRRSQDADTVFQALLAGLGPPEHRVWAAAEPYLLQHALDHATNAAPLLEDPGFLLYADPAKYLPLLDEAARQRAVACHPRDSVAERRARFAATAAAQGRGDLARRMADLPGEQPLSWLPLWVHGRARAAPPTPSALVAMALDERGQLRLWNWPGPVPRLALLPGVGAFALGQVGGQLAVVTGTPDGTVRVLGPDGAVMTLPGPRAALTALEVVDHRTGPVLLSSSEDGRVLTHTLADGQEIRPPVTIPGGPVSVLAAGGDVSAPVVACANSNGHLWVWRLEEGPGSSLYHWELPAAVRAVAVGRLSDRPIVLVGCADGVARSWDYEMRTPRKVYEGHRGPVRAVAFGSLRRRTVALTGGQDGTVHVWDLLTGHLVNEPVQVCRGQVLALAARATPSSLHCLVGSPDRTVLWDLVKRIQLREFPVRGATSVALGPGNQGLGISTAESAARQLSALEVASVTGGRAVAILGDGAGAVCAIEFDSGHPVLDPMAAVGHPVTSIDMVRLGGLVTARIRSGVVTRFWQLSTGAVAAIPADEEPHQLADAHGETHAIIDAKLVSVLGTPTGSVLIDNEPLGTHPDAVSAATTTHLAGQPVAITGDMQGCVRIWDLAQRAMLDELQVGAPVFAIAATANGRLLVGAGGQAHAFLHLTSRQPEA